MEENKSCFFSWDNHTVPEAGKSYRNTHQKHTILGDSVYHSAYAAVACWTFSKNSSTSGPVILASVICHTCVTCTLSPSLSRFSTVTSIGICVQKKRPKCFFVIFPIKLRWFWRNLIHRFLNTFATKWCKRFPSHLNSVSLEMLIGHALPCCYRKKL